MLIISVAMIATPIESILTGASSLSVQIDNIRSTPLMDFVPTEDGDEPVTMISRTYAMPFRNASLQVQHMSWRVFDTAGNYLYDSQERSTEDASISSVIQFREMTAHTVRIETQKRVGNTIMTLNDIEYTIEYSDSVPIPQSISPAFVSAYEQLASNYQTSYLRGLPYSRPKMLIISHTALEPDMEPFVTWKKSRGFDVYVAYKQDIGNTVAEIKNYIISHYNEFHCDYLLLLGDVNGSFAIPTNMHPSPDTGEFNADDNHYAIIEGNDYFPDMLVGRFSFGERNEFLTMRNKTINYERSPFMTDTNWMKKGLFVAGNWAEGNLRPITPVQMSRSVRERMLEYGYTAVDTVFYPPTYPGTSLIQQSINQGVQIIMYRGWGDANGWHYPYFHIPDLNNTFNGPKLPMVYSIVCNTGDFANNVNPSFGERWMRMGTPTSAAGCVAFVGPSDLHTKTRFNNSVSTGMMRGIHDYHTRIFGSSVLAGKIELYNNFPNNQGPADHVEFYFRVYNILSDPSMNMWILEPNVISSNVIASGLTFTQSDSHVRIVAPHLNGAVVTGSKDLQDFSYTIIEDGLAILPMNPEEAGNFRVTITKANWVPLVADLTPEGEAGLGIVGNSLAGTTVNANTENNMVLTFKNYSSGTLTNVSVALATENEDMVEIDNATQTIASLGSGATTTLGFPLSFSSEIHPRDIMTFTATINPGNKVHYFQLKAGGAEFVVINHAGSLPLGQDSPISFEVTNIGSAALSNAEVEIYSLTNAATVSTPIVNLGSFAIGETKTVNTTIHVQPDTYNGRNIPLKFTVSDNQNYSITAFYAVTAGNPGTTDPTGPCEYGYFAYDSFDVGFPEAPVYDWIPVDPSAEIFLNMDDGSRVIDLPFTFRFYGRDYQQITVCTNGWMSFGATWMADFYNHFIPAALGPNAMIAGYWDDLKGMKTGVNPDGSGIFNDISIAYWHDVPNNRYIIDWEDAYNQYNIDLMENASLERFQIILYPKDNADGDIVVQYHTVDNPGLTTNFCTVGIEDHSQTRGLTYTFANFYPPTATPLQAGLAIKFTTTPPDTYVSNSDPVLAVPFTLAQNYPNPFNPTTTISFNLAQNANANLRIYNLKGQLVKTLLSAPTQAGNHSIVWEGDDDSGRAVSSGIYFYQLNTENYSSTRKMLLMK